MPQNCAALSQGLSYFHPHQSWLRNAPGRMEPLGASVSHKYREQTPVAPVWDPMEEPQGRVMWGIQDSRELHEEPSPTAQELLVHENDSPTVLSSAKITKGFFLTRLEAMVLFSSYINAFRALYESCKWSVLRCPCSKFSPTTCLTHCLKSYY